MISNTTPEQHAAHVAKLEAYHKKLREGQKVEPPKPPETKPTGPGDHLHALIIQFTGESTKLGCGCKDRINQMNRWGVAGCIKNIDRIVNWMQEEATKRGWKSAKWLGSKTAIKLLIRLAIRRAKNTKDIE